MLIYILNHGSQISPSYEYSCYMYNVQMFVTYFVSYQLDLDGEGPGVGFTFCQNKSNGFKENDKTARILQLK